MILQGSSGAVVMVMVMVMVRVGLIVMTVEPEAVL